MALVHPTPPVVVTGSGAVQGSWTPDGTARFLAVPYAAPPVGARRFAAAAPHPGWEGVRPCTRWGAAPPQLGARLESIVGPLGRPRQSEDCLVVNIWTPSVEPTAGLPVMVWFHGGAFFCDSASNRCYDGRNLAATGRVVVVTVEYRLGALGYLHLPPSRGFPQGVSNLGLTDQIRSLEWVAENIRGFGGDPDRVTAFGQSAGAYSIAALIAQRRSASMIRRAVLQSCPFGWTADREDLSADVASAFVRSLGPGAGPDVLREAPVSEILRAQADVMAQFRRFGDLGSAFAPVVDGTVLTVDPFTAVQAGAGRDIEMILGAQADEARCFIGLEPGIWGRTREDIAERLERSRGRPFADCFGAYCDSEPGLAPAQALSLLVGDDSIMIASLAIAEARARAGAGCYQYLLTWPSPLDGGRYGACHTLEAPFVFGDLAQWSEAPVVSATDPADFAVLRTAMQGAWISFAENGRPVAPGLAPWPRYRDDSRRLMQFDVPPRSAEDPVPRRREIVRRYLTGAFQGL